MQSIGVSGTPAGVRFPVDSVPVVSLRSTTGYRLSCLRHDDVDQVDAERDDAVIDPRCVLIADVFGAA